MHDSRELSGYRDNLAGVRRAVDAILERFVDHQVHATWATVGLLMCAGADEALELGPEVWPQYDIPAMSPRALLSRDGAARRFPEHHFAPEVVERVARAPGQEIGTHTFSHYYCLEEGPTLEAFRADLDAAHRVAKRRGVELRSIVFPRNQYTDEHLRVCREVGIHAYRGNPPFGPYRPLERGGQRPWLRAMRLLDAHLPLTPSSAYVPRWDHGAVDVRASRFLRPTASFGGAALLRLRRILAEMRAAASSGLCYHLWWHPHNFGRHLEANLRMLDAILEHFSYLAGRFEMRSRAMGELGAELRGDR